MTVLKTCQGLVERISIVQDIRNSVVETRELESRTSEINKICLYLRGASERVQLLRANGVPVDIRIIDLSGVVKPLEKIIGRFSQERKASSLTKGKDWVNFSDNAKIVNEDIEETTNATWSKYAQGKFSGEKPNDLNIAKTDQNMKIFEEYSDEYEEFSYCIDSFPEDVEQIQKTIKHAEKLNSLRQSFDFDVPKSVGEFLSAVASGGATLDLLTSEVITWLESNQSMTQFKIVRKL